jgi:hypothetical protein
MTKEMKKKYYDNNKEKLITYQVNRYRELSGIFNEWRKSLVCSKCGENDKACLEFHHCEPAEKEQNVIKMVARGLKSVLRELNKCVVVCANCHCKIHAYNQETKPDYTLSTKFEKFYNNVSEKTTIIK